MDMNIIIFLLVVSFPDSLGMSTSFSGNRTVNNYNQMLSYRTMRLGDGGGCAVYQFVAPALFLQDMR